RKLEFLCGAALAEQADCLVTVGAAQSNHCRMTAAAGAVLGLEVHLVLAAEELAGEPGEASGQAAASSLDTSTVEAFLADASAAATERVPTRKPTVAPTGNRLLSAMFGATQHVTDNTDWTDLSADAFALADELQAAGRHPYVIAAGGSTAVGAAGYVAAYAEIVNQCQQLGIEPAAIVHATSSGGTHAGLVAGRAALKSAGQKGPRCVGVSVAKSPTVDDPGATAALAQACLGVLGLSDVEVSRADIDVVHGFLGDGYASPTREADAAIQWAARRGAWVLDRVYTGKAMAGLLWMAADEERFGVGEDVIFLHTGGQPAVFAPGGAVAGIESL
ncbi:MAG TPA: pyridoxal-phosphate dependent enzyme, partial [Acidimicrobiales bacterium]|nr:pyridoxal-phosphate dependent enzyme [Acidimicrobiales bacterium]